MAVALFAVMLIVLAALMATNAFSGRHVERIDHVDERPAVSVAQRAIRAPYRARTVWVLGPDGFLGRIDHSKIVGAFDGLALGESAATSLGVGTDLAITLDKTELGSFQMKWRLGDPIAAGDIVAERIDWRDRVALAKWAAVPGQVLIFAHAGAFDALPHVDEALRAGQRGHDFAMLRSSESFMVLARYRSSFFGPESLRAR